MNILNQYINQIILMLILALAAWLGAQAKNLYRKYIDITPWASCPENDTLCSSFPVATRYIHD